MATYKAPPTPWRRKLAGSSGFHMFLLVTVVVASVYFVYLRSKSTSGGDSSADVVASSDNTESTAPSASAADAKSALPTPPPEPKFGSPTAKALSLAASTAAGMAGAANSGEAPPEGAKTGENESVTTASERMRFAESGANALGSQGTQKKLGTNLRVVAHFVELSQSAIPLVFSGASDSGATGIIPDFFKKFREAQRSSIKDLRANELTRVEKNIEYFNTPVRFDQTLTESVGFFIKVSAISVSEQTASLDIQIQYRGPSPQPGSAGPTQDFENTFQIQNNGAAYFGDVLPRTAPQRPEDEDLFSRHPVFKILTLPNYLNNSSEFLIFFEVVGLEGGQG